MEAMQPELHPETQQGLVILNTGDGKGKTTAALGMMTRAWGHQMRVGMVQFLKPEDGRLGESRAAERMGIDVVGTGEGWTWGSPDLEHTEALARKGWETA